MTLYIFLTKQKLLFKKFTVRREKACLRSLSLSLSLTHTHTHTHTERGNESILSTPVHKFVKSVYYLPYICPSVCLCPHRTTRLLLDGGHEIWYMRVFRNCVEKFQVRLKYKTNNRYLILRPCTVLIISRRIIPRMRNI